MKGLASLHRRKASGRLTVGGAFAPAGATNAGRRWIEPVRPLERTFTGPELGPRRSQCHHESHGGSSLWRGAYLQLKAAHSTRCLSLDGPTNAHAPCSRQRAWTNARRSTATCRFVHCRLWWPGTEMRHQRQGHLPVRPLSSSSAATALRAGTIEQGASRTSSSTSQFKHCRSFVANGSAKTVSTPTRHAVRVGAMRRSNALFADAVVRGGEVLSQQLSRSTDGRGRGRNSLRSSMVRSIGWPDPSRRGASQRSTTGGARPGPFVRFVRGRTHAMQTSLR